jgi:uncharacterized protein (TIGR03067 family)
VVFDSNGFWLSTNGLVGEYYRSLRVTITDKRITIKSDKDSKPAPAGIPFSWDHSYKADATKEPAEIDIRLLVFSADRQPEESGRVLHGIYELQGDQLVMCIDREEPSKRPRNFALEKGRFHLIMLLKREK